MGAPNVEPFGRQPPPPPVPTRSEYERKVKAEAEALRRAREQQVQAPADRMDMTQAETPDFLNQVNGAAHLLSTIGIELGNVGHDDKAALQQFAAAMQENTRRYVGQLIQRKRRELADLERILGKL
jgi:hypothetical protein